MLAPDASLADPAGSGERPPAGGALRRFAERAGRRAEEALERCDFCAEPLPAAHRHLLEVETQTLKCVCQACRLLFDREAASAGRYRLVPDRRPRLLADFALSQAEWDRLRIPVGIAFVLKRSAAGGQAVACYPGPMGVTEGAVLAEDDWSALAAREPALAGMQADVEAMLLAHGARGASGAPQYYLVPVDECYRLAGLFRVYWRGLSGGPAVWREVDRYFESLRGRCDTVRGAAAAAP